MNGRTIGRRIERDRQAKVYRNNLQFRRYPIDQLKVDPMPSPTQIPLHIRNHIRPLIGGDWAHVGRSE